MPRGASSASVVERVWQTLERDPRIDTRAHPLVLAFDDGTLVVEGELADVAAKVQTLALAQELPEVRRVVDRLVVPAPVEMTDGEMRAAYQNALFGELAFEDCQLVMSERGSLTIVHDPPDARGRLVASIDDGIVTLSGEVQSLSHARLAGVLAWWVPGTRAVVNELSIEPPEEDNDGELNDAVRTALEAEPLLDADQLVVRTTEGRVTLSGTLRSEEQRRIAERDAWYVLGVRAVVNQIDVVY
jgi:BON domain